jgi:hypothetical protein
MKFPKTQSSGIGTVGATGITLLILHVTGYLVGWAWPILYIMLIVAGAGNESRNRK